MRRISLRSDVCGNALFEKYVISFYTGISIRKHGISIEQEHFISLSLKSPILYRIHLNEVERARILPDHAPH